MKKLKIEQRKEKKKCTIFLRTWMKLAVVISLEAPSDTSFQRATFLSGIFQSRNFPSRLPERKYWSWRGWKQMAVTKSMCWKQHKHSFLKNKKNNPLLSFFTLKYLVGHKLGQHSKKEKRLYVEKTRSSASLSNTPLLKKLLIILQPVQISVSLRAYGILATTCYWWSRMSNMRVDVGRGTN